MNKQEQRIAIAKACGTHLVSVHPEGWVLTDKSGYTGLIKENGYDTDTKFSFPKDYLNDLNAMHEAEKVLTAEQWDDYGCKMECTPYVIQNWIHATAAKRAEAFLKTLNLWTK